MQRQHGRAVLTRFRGGCRRILPAAGGCGQTSSTLPPRRCGAVSVAHARARSGDKQLSQDDTTGDAQPLVDVLTGEDGSWPRGRGRWWPVAQKHLWLRQARWPRAVSAAGELGGMLATALSQADDSGEAPSRARYSAPWARHDLRIAHARHCFCISRLNCWKIMPTRRRMRMSPRRGMIWCHVKMSIGCRWRFRGSDAATKAWTSVGAASYLMMPHISPFRFSNSRRRVATTRPRHG